MAQDATWAWAQTCATYNFPTVAAAGATATFASAYEGGDFDRDFPGVLRAVAELMATDTPDYDGNDYLAASVTNWPDA